MLALLLQRLFLKALKLDLGVFTLESNSVSFGTGRRRSLGLIYILTVLLEEFQGKEIRLGFVCLVVDKRIQNVVNFGP